MECVVCGGTNFTKESGYFFCSECQTQSQEIKEHAFQEETTQIHTKSTRKIKDKQQKVSDHITSWECYNVIIMMLTEELINLGVDRSIKKIVKCLWFRYLEKLEILNLEHDEKPKFSLVNTKKDLSIVYGIKRKRKRKKSLSDESSFTESTSRRERTKKKRALAQAQYTALSIKSKTEGSSLHDETLTSLKSSSEKSVENEEILFNKYSAKELKNIMSTDHLKKHKSDLISHMKCHNLNTRTVPSKYLYGVHFISPVKIYGILYIALLIKKDPMQLGDLFRFMREGHLSFNTYTSLFPEHYNNKALNIENNTVHNIYRHTYFRKVVAKMVQFLEVGKYITCPDLLELSKRYCKELNLPDEVSTAVSKVLALNRPKFKTTKSCIPDYEGRIMSIIIFVLKLLYGLDDVSERNLSDYAKSVNNEWEDLKMFDIIAWMEFINYRRLMISENHFPSYIAENERDMNADLYLQYKKSHNLKVDDSTKLMMDMNAYKDILSKIQSLQYDYVTHIEYPADICPFTSHSEVIVKLLKETGMDSTGIKQGILEKNFEDNSLDFLLRPLTYLWQANKNRIAFKNGGLNDNWTLNQLETRFSLAKISYDALKFVRAEIVTHQAKQKKSVINNNETTSKSIQNIQREFAKYHKLKFQENFQHLMKFKRLQLKEQKHPQNIADYNVHCFPYERYWLYLTMTIDHISQEQFDRFFKKFSKSFKLILNECARVIEQSNQDLYQEFQQTELYLVYCGKKYNGCEKRSKLSNLGVYLRNIKARW